MTETLLAIRKVLKDDLFFLDSGNFLFSCSLFGQFSNLLRQQGKVVKNSTTVCCRLLLYKLRMEKDYFVYFTGQFTFCFVTMSIK